MDKHEYEVGIMSNVARIKAPTAEAAALFYGLHAGGNMLLGAAVYKKDGGEYSGEKIPFGKWQFNTYLSESEQNKLKDKLTKLKPLVDECEFTEEKD